MRLCFYHTALRQNAVFHNFSRQITLSQHSGPSIVRFQQNHSKNVQNHLYGQPVLTFVKRQICNASCGRISNIIKNLFIFYLKVFERCVILKSVDTCSVLTTPASNVCEQLKTNSTAIKIPKKTTKHQQKKYNSLKHLQRQQFSFAKTSLEVSLKILSL